MNKSDLTAVQLEALTAAAAPNGCKSIEYKFRTWENLKKFGLVTFTYYAYSSLRNYTATEAGRALLAEPDRPKLSPGQAAFVEKWGKKEDFTHIYIFDLKGNEHRIAEILAERFKFLTLVKPQIYPKTWYYEWTEVGKAWVWTLTG